MRLAVVFFMAICGCNKQPPGPPAPTPTPTAGNIATVSTSPVGANSEFKVSGSITLSATVDDPSQEGVLLQIVGRARGGKETIVDSKGVEPQSDDGRTLRFETVMRSPRAPGTYSLRVRYLRTTGENTMVAESELSVR